MGFLKHKRSDANQSDVIDELRCNPELSIKSVSDFGLGFDIIVGYRGKNFFFELKNPKAPVRDRRLTDNEQKFVSSWQGQVDVVTTADEILQIIHTYAAI